ncbi:MAG: hypothetical protein ABEH64_13450 [Salinirussus sp.]
MEDDLPTNPDEALAYLSDDDRGDGLPVVPATQERVDDMAAEATRSANETITAVPTGGDDLTVERLANCAVMAGCAPEYMPVLEAAFEGFGRMENLAAALATTSGFAPAVLVNGPIRDDLGFNDDTGLFGPCFRANATIGRAITLAFVVVGGTRPRQGTMATQTHPGRYTFCFAENEEAAAWEPVHVARAGFDAEESAVTALCLQAPKLFSEGDLTDPSDVLTAAVDGVSAASTTGMPAGESVVVLGQDHAGRLGEAYSRNEVAEHLVDNAERWDGDPLFESTDDILIAAGGGIGNYSSAIPMWPRGTPPQTVRIGG